MDALFMIKILMVKYCIDIIMLLEIKFFNEKPDMYLSNTINCGVYLFSVGIFNMSIFKGYKEKYEQIVKISKD